MAINAIIRKNATSRARSEKPATAAPASVAAKKKLPPIRSLASMVACCLQGQGKIGGARLLVGADLKISGGKTHVARAPEELKSPEKMNPIIREPGRILKNIRPMTALGADARSRRQLFWNMIQANLKRTHNGWLKMANRLLGTEPVTVQLRFWEAMPFCYRPGTTDLLALEQVFLDGQYDVESIAPETVEFIVDLGGNIGVTAMLWARRYPAARMVLVEPDPGNFALLERNTAVFRDRCLLINAAVSDRCGQTSFFRSEREYGHSLLKGDDCVSEIRVETLTMPAILHRAGFPRVDLLKMDIEGGEQIVMPTIDSWGATTRHLIAELHPPYDLEAFADDCRKISLKVESFHGDMAFAAGTDKDNAATNWRRSAVSG